VLSLEVPVVVPMYIDIIHGSVVKISHCITGNVIHA
jgi:hypothetical protein